MYADTWRLEALAWSQAVAAPARLTAAVTIAAISAAVMGWR
jgi:hypothetical protein